MRTLAGLRGVASTIAVSVLLLAGAGSASAEQDPLIVTTPREITVAQPLPGHTSTWSMTVTNSTDATVDLVLQVDGPADDAMRDLLVLNVRSGDGHLVAGTIAEVLGSGAVIGPLAARGTLMLDASVSLPREVGNEAQGLSSEVTLRVVATADDAASPGPTGPGTSLGPIIDVETDVTPGAETQTAGTQSDEAATTTESTLGSTGATLDVLGVGLAALAVGMFVIVAVRRRRKDSDHS